ncbi:hypothetical protein JST97_30580 [bacterium]|nr:hypothetical protein [bacterium]
MRISPSSPVQPRALPPRPPQASEPYTYMDSVYEAGEHTDLCVRLNTGVFTPLMFVPVVGPVMGGVTVAGCLGLSLQSAYAAHKHGDRDLMKRSLLNAAISGTLTGAAASMLGVGPPALGPALVGAAALMVVGREVRAHLNRP